MADSERREGTTSAAVMTALISVAMVLGVAVLIVRAAPHQFWPVVFVCISSLGFPGLLGYMVWNHWPAMKRFKSFMPRDLRAAWLQMLTAYVLLGVTQAFAAFELARGCR